SAVPLDAAETLPGKPSFERCPGGRGHEARRGRQSRSVFVPHVRLRRHSRMSSADARQQASLRKYGCAGECDEGRTRSEGLTKEEAGPCGPRPLSPRDSASPLLE